MSEHLTERAREVFVLAQDAANSLGHNYIGTEHLLLGLIREREGLAAYVLDALDVTPEMVTGEITRTLRDGRRTKAEAPKLLFAVYDDGSTFVAAPSAEIVRRVVNAALGFPVSLDFTFGDDPPRPTPHENRTTESGA